MRKKSSLVILASCGYTFSYTYKGENRMNHEIYLNMVLKKLEAAIKEQEQKIELHRTEISKMQEYFWESYTEYDEYGYEKIDNEDGFECAKIDMGEIKITK